MSVPLRVGTDASHTLCTVPMLPVNQISSVSAPKKDFNSCQLSVPSVLRGWIRFRNVSVPTSCYQGFPVSVPVRCSYAPFPTCPPS